MASKKVEARIGRQTLSLESGQVAKQADGAVLVRYGDTVVLVAAVSAKPKFPMDFFPLRVDYREMTYAAGKFPGGFFKREGRPTQKEVKKILSVHILMQWFRMIHAAFTYGMIQFLLVNPVLVDRARFNAEVIPHP